MGDKFVKLFVLRICWRIYHIWPLAVARDFGRCFATNSGVSHGYDWKNHVRIAYIHVEGAGPKAAL